VHSILSAFNHPKPNTKITWWTVLFYLLENQPILSIQLNIKVQLGKINNSQELALVITLSINGTWIEFCSEHAYWLVLFALGSSYVDSLAHHVHWWGLFGCHAHWCGLFGLSCPCDLAHIMLTCDHCEDNNLLEFR
jgi:hypothetical protein